MSDLVYKYYNKILIYTWLGDYNIMCNYNLFLQYIKAVSYTHLYNNTTTKGNIRDILTRANVFITHNCKERILFISRTVTRTDFLSSTHHQYEKYWVLRGWRQLLAFLPVSLPCINPLGEVYWPILSMGGNRLGLFHDCWLLIISGDRDDGHDSWF